jgi:hypothetical protein
VEAETVDRLAHDLLDAALHAYYVVDGAPPPPERHFVSLTRPVFECPSMLTVHFVTLSNVGPPASASEPLFATGAAQPCHVVPAVELHVTVVRCVSGPGEDGAPPPDETIEEEAALVMRDVATLWKHLVRAGLDGELFPSVPGVGCHAIRWGQFVPVEASGGVAALELTVEVVLT